MSIFSEFGGKSSYYTANELDRLQNPEKYDYDQESYDAFSAQVQKKADSRQAAVLVLQTPHLALLDIVGKQAVVHLVSQVLAD